MVAIRCRARVTERCYGVRGISETSVYPDGEQREDGTYQHSTDTVVCDVCYMALGAPLRDDLEAAVAAAHAAGRGR